MSILTGLRNFEYDKRFLNRWVLCIFWTHDSFFDDFERLFQAESNFFETSIFEILNHFSTILFEKRFFLFLTQIWGIWICCSGRSSKCLTNINAEIWWNIGWIFMRYKDLQKSYIDGLEKSIGRNAWNGSVTLMRSWIASSIACEFFSSNFAPATVCCWMKSINSAT